MNKSNNHRVFSGALQFTIFIGVIIALILAGLVLLQNTHTFFIQQSKATIENIQLTNSGISFLKHQDNFTADTTIVNQLSDENQKVEVQSSPWGIYEKAIVKSTHRQKIFYKCALLGSQIDGVKRPNLYLQDSFKPLFIAGNTVLKGNIFLPYQGVRPGYIVGEGFYGIDLIKGKSYRSDVKLPELMGRYREIIERLAKFSEVKQENYLGESNLSKYYNSFLKPTKSYFSKTEIVLDKNELTGNIIIKSEVKIKVKNSAILKDVILIAPVIEFEDKVSGNFQVFASIKITIGKECKFNYPSSIVLIEEKGKNIGVNHQESELFIDEKTEIRGTVIYFKNTVKTDDNFKTQITLSKGSILKGEVYCEGNFELLGKVVGSVYTEQFIVNKSGSIFINHIYNGQIVNDDFPESFCGLLFKKNQKGVVKWIY